MKVINLALLSTKISQEKRQNNDNSICSNKIDFTIKQSPFQIEQNNVKDTNICLPQPEIEKKIDQYKESNSKLQGPTENESSENLLSSLVFKE